MLFIKTCIKGLHISSFFIHRLKIEKALATNLIQNLSTSQTTFNQILGRQAYYERVCISQQLIWERCNFSSYLKSYCLVWVDHLHYSLCNGLLQKQLSHIFCKFRMGWFSWMSCMFPQSTERICMVKFEN